MDALVEGLDICWLCLVYTAIVLDYTLSTLFISVYEIGSNRVALLVLAGIL